MKNFILIILSFIGVIGSTCILINPVKWTILDLVIRYLAMGLWLVCTIIMFYRFSKFPDSEKLN